MNEIQGALKTYFCQARKPWSKKKFEMSSIIIKASFKDVCGFIIPRKLFWIFTTPSFFIQIFTTPSFFIHSNSIPSWHQMCYMGSLHHVVDHYCHLHLPLGGSEMQNLKVYSSSYVIVGQPRLEFNFYRNGEDQLMHVCFLRRINNRNMTLSFLSLI